MEALVLVVIGVFFLLSLKKGPVPVAVSPPSSAAGTEATSQKTVQQPTQQQSIQQNTPEDYLNNPALKKMFSTLQDLGKTAISDLMSGIEVFSDLKPTPDISMSMLSGVKSITPVSSYLSSAAGAVGGAIAPVGTAFAFPVLCLSQIISGLFQDGRPSKATSAMFNGIIDRGIARAEYLRSQGLTEWQIFVLCTNNGLIASGEKSYDSQGGVVFTDKVLGVFTMSEWEVILANQLIGYGSISRDGADSSTYNTDVISIDPYSLQGCPHPKPTSEFGNPNLYQESDMPIPVYNGQYSASFVDSQTTGEVMAFAKMGMWSSWGTWNAQALKNISSVLPTWPDLWKAYLSYNKNQIQIADQNQSTLQINGLKFLYS